MMPSVNGGEGDGDTHTVRMDPLRFYAKVAHVPTEARKAISAGRLKGKTDINPMWRIKALTETFGPCGFGWKYVIRDQRTMTAPDGFIKAFVDIDLYVRDPETGEWSEPIPGIGGNDFYKIEDKGAYANDECFKSALTDAISVACKALGVGADVYWSSDTTKYTTLSDGSVWAHAPTEEEEKAEAQLMTVYADERFRSQIDEIVRAHIVEAEAKLRLDAEAAEEQRRRENRARLAEQAKAEEEARKAAKARREADTKGAEVVATEQIGDDVGRRMAENCGVDLAQAKLAIIRYRNSHTQTENEILSRFIEDNDGQFMVNWSSSTILECYKAMVLAGHIEDTASKEVAE